MKSCSSPIRAESGGVGHAGASFRGCVARLVRRAFPGDPTDAQPYAADRAGSRPQVAIVANSAWNIVNFRSGLIRALQGDGWDVVILAPRDKYAASIEALGCRFVELSMNCWCTNPWSDYLLLRRLKHLLRCERPAALLCYTIKPNVYASLAARSLGIPVINTISGLGAGFMHSLCVKTVVRLLYRVALKRSYRVLFQNGDDHHYFVSTGLVPVERAGRVPGSGMDLTTFAAAPMPPLGKGQPLRFLLVARMLGDKGIREFAEAARLVRLQGIDAEFQLLGPIDAHNPNSIPRDEIDAWQRADTVRYLGSTDDVRPFLAQAHCVVLPSYREGVPRTLLEAASMARPTIATDVAGCRDAVEDGVTGYLVRPADAPDLADKLLRFARRSPSEQAQMGRDGRSKVEREFSEQLVIDKYIALLQSLKIARSSSSGIKLPASERVPVFLP